MFDLLCKYRRTVNIRGEIGTCTKIELDSQVIDKSSFFIRPVHVKEEDKPKVERNVQ